MDYEHTEQLSWTEAIAILYGQWKLDYGHQEQKSFFFLLH